MSGSWVALGAAAWSLIFAVIHALWASGWYLGLPAPEAQKAFEHTWFLIYDLVIAGLGVVGVFVALTLARPSTSRRRNHLAFVLGCAGTAVLALRAGGGFLQTLYLVATGRYVFELVHLYEPWFCLGAVLFAVSTWKFWRGLSSKGTRAAASHARAADARSATSSGEARFAGLDAGPDGSAGKGPMKRSGLLVFVSALAMADTPPVDVRPWRPAGVSSSRFESHAAFDPRTGELYFVRSSPQFEGWRILVSRCGEDGWSPPSDPVFAGDGLEADPFFSADGRRLYFISSRSTDGVRRKDLDIWWVDRDARGAWGVPVRLPEPVNSPGAEWFPRPAADGWLYFGSDRPGGLGGNDIWRARVDAAGRWVAENLGPGVNTPRHEYEPLPSPDGSRMIIATDGGLYMTTRVNEAWSKSAKLPPPVSVNGTEIGPVFSPSGRSLLFSRDTKGPDSGEFFVLRFEGWEDWPPACPRASAP